MMKWPFAAIGLLIDNSLMVKAKTIRINMKKSIKKYDSLE